MSQMFQYNILVTLNRSYLKVLSTMLYSLSQSDMDGVFTVYIAHNSLTAEDFAALGSLLPRTNLVDVRLSNDLLENAPVSDRYPTEMYYRIFAAQYLPKNLDRILYLDPDIIVINSLRALYSIDFKDHLFAAASHIESRSFQEFNRLRLNLSAQSKYINSGVMMMNLSLLRTEQSTQQVFDFIAEHKNSLLLPDQDVLNALYTDRIIFLDPLIYNLGEKYLHLKNMHLPKDRQLDVDWVRQHTAIIHYYGRNKPWKENFHGVLGGFYHNVVSSMPLDDGNDLFPAV